MTQWRTWARDPQGALGPAVACVETTAVGNVLELVACACCCCCWLVMPRSSDTTAKPVVASMSPEFMRLNMTGHRLPSHFKTTVLYSLRKDAAEPRRVPQTCWIQCRTAGGHFIVWPRNNLKSTAGSTGCPRTGWQPWQSSKKAVQSSGTTCLSKKLRRAVHCKAKSESEP